MNAPSLHVAVPADVDPYWLDLLMRSGVPVRRIGTCDHAAAVLFLPDGAGLNSRATRLLVERCRQQGMGIVAGAHWGSALLGGRIRTLHATGVLTGARGLPEQPVRLFCDIDVPAEANAGRVWPADIPASASSSTPSPMLVLPLPSAAALLASPARMVAMPVGQREVAEIVSGVDHGALRAQCTAALAAMAHASGRPFARLAGAPAGFGGTLSIRIDADGFTPAATAAVLASLQQAQLRATWFIDVERHLASGGGREAIAVIAAAGHEVQSHFFRHYTYRSAKRNHANLQRSIDELAALGITVTAAAAPFGSWNAGILAAVDACGLDWSSEFARAHDDVPGAFGGDPDGPWQVPVHPVCPALLLAAGCSEGEVGGYFAELLADKLSAGEPAVFYGHPIGELERCPDLLPHLGRLADTRQGPVWRPTLGELFAFHRARADQFVECLLGRDIIAGEVSGPAALWIDQPSGSRIAVQGTFEVARDSQPGPAVESGPGPILIPAAWQGTQAREQRRRGRRLALGRLLRELRR